MSMFQKKHFTVYLKLKTKYSHSSCCIGSLHNRNTLMCFWHRALWKAKCEYLVLLDFKSELCYLFTFFGTCLFNIKGYRCVCVRAYGSAVCDNEILHVAKMHPEGKQGCFSLGSCFTERTFSSFCFETQKHDDSSSSTAHCVSLPGITPAFCLVNHSVP